MTLPKLQLDVPQEGYSLTDGDAVLRARPSAGPSRQRLDMLGAPSIVDVALTLDPAEYQYWRVFRNVTLKQGSLPFLIDLVIDSAEVAEYEAKITGPTRSAVQGTAHIVSFQLEVKMPATDTDYDDSLAMLYEVYGADAPYVLADLAELVNVVLPANLQ